MAGPDRRTHVYAMRANQSQNEILQRCMAQEDAPNGAWFVQACIAYAMLHLPPGGLNEWVEEIQPARRIWSRPGESEPAPTGAALPSP